MHGQPHIRFLETEVSLIHMCKSKSVPLQAWTGPEDSRKLRFPDFVTTAHDSGRLSALRTGRLYTPRKHSRYSFLLEAESTTGLQCDRKDFVLLTQSGIESATFRFVAQHLNHCANAVPLIHMYTYRNSYSVTTSWNRRQTAALLYLPIKHIYPVTWK
jgi:hypothetical protein